MKAWRLHGYGDLRLDDVPMPELRPGWVLVQVKVVQPSITEVELVQGVALAHLRAVARRLEQKEPVVLGHEFCGRVAEVGEGVTSLKKGDRVTAAAMVHCGTCPMCQRGLPSRCSNALYMGAAGGPISGAFSEFVCIPERGLVKVPEGPSDNEVSAFQPLDVCVDSVRLGGVKLGDTVAVIGQGPIGWGCLQLARLAGARLLIGIDVRDENLALSKQYGADATINSKQVDSVAAVRELTEGLGPDVIFECAGGNTQYGLSGFDTVHQAFRMVCRSGTVVEVSNLEGTAELDLPTLRRKNIRFIFPDRGSVESLRMVANLAVAGRIRLKPQITHVLEGLSALPQALEITGNKAKYGALQPAQVVVS